MAHVFIRGLSRAVQPGLKLASPANHIVLGSSRGPARALNENQCAQMAYDSSNQVHKRIDGLISKSKKPVFVFMKGEPSEPACRYSGVVVQILDAYGVEFDSFNVLADEEVRQEIKTYSDWPTIPQVFKDGELVGGCDILLQMHQSGELKKTFDIADGSAKADK